jgi:phosphatidylserine/phosphatidylglycerophosphate/cardiolipin synthase-like enzyme
MKSTVSIRVGIAGAFALFLALALASCAQWTWPWPGSATELPYDDALVARDASASPLQPVQARILTDNDQAFLSKLRIIEGARQTLDLAYYIYNDDYSSSYFTQALIAAARRGVKVRLLVDYSTNYNRLDLFSMMEERGNQGKGSLQVRLYNRPTAGIVADAIYATMGCGNPLTPQTASTACSKEKLAQVEQLMAAETIDGQPAAPQLISNLDVGGSGMLLSGLYARSSPLIAFAVEQGEGIDPKALAGGSGKASAQQRAQLTRVGKMYLHTRTGPVFGRLAARAELAVAFLDDGSQLRPLSNTVNDLLPLGRQLSPQEAKDWDHFTDYLHHKLILGDSRFLQMGGRNVEDSYHMHTNPLTKKYVFMDTDIYAELGAGGPMVTAAYERLWNFRRMVASLAEVRQHAPNDFAVNLPAFEAAQGKCPANSPPDCLDRAFAAGARSLEERVAALASSMDANARVYAQNYLPKIPPSDWPIFELPAGAQLAFLENLPFHKAAAAPVRFYGVPAGEEATHGKYIHDVWLHAFPALCRPDGPPQELILHSAYFFPPPRLVSVLGQMIGGGADCSRVSVTVLTNSLQTTDLSIVNVFARHSVKAFAEFFEAHAQTGRSAKFQYLDYNTPPGSPNLSLHTKASVVGDDLILGSANADVRSYYMDSNDVMLIRGAGATVGQYRAWLHGVMADGKRVVSRNAELLKEPRSQMIQEDLAWLDAELKRYHVDKHLSAPERAELEKDFVALLDRAYNDTRQLLDPATGAKEREKIENDFDELFKPI